MHYIEVALKPGLKDAIGNAVKADIEEDLLIKGVDSVKFVEGYKINAGFSQQEIEKIAQAFSDPIIQDYSVDQPVIEDFDWIISVRYHDDVTDNVGLTAEEAIKDLGLELKEEEHVRSERKYLIKGSLTQEQAERICKGLLANELIESFEFKKREQND